MIEDALTNAEKIPKVQSSKQYQLPFSCICSTPMGRNYKTFFVEDFSSKIKMKVMEDI